MSRRGLGSRVLGSLATARERWPALVPAPLVELVPRDHRETEEAFARRRRVVAGVGTLGAGLLAVSLSSKPDSPRFYVTTFATAATWVAGGLAAGPLHRGQMWTTDQALKRPLVTPVLSGVVVFGGFYGLALVAREIPVLRQAIASVLQFAERGTGPLVLATTLTNGLAEEVFFRGALYAALPDGRQVEASTLAYTLATAVTRNPALTLAAAVMGTVFGVQRRVTGGIQAPILTHLTWSALMLKFLPPLFRDLTREGAPDLDSAGRPRR